MVGVVGAGNCQQPVCCFGWLARGQLDQPERPLGAYGRERRAASLAQRERFFCVLAGILLMAPGGLDGGHVHQVPA